MNLIKLINDKMKQDVEDAEYQQQLDHQAEYEKLIASPFPLTGYLSDENENNDDETTTD